MTNLREQILAADDRPYEDVIVPEWDTTVRIRGLNAATAETFGRKVAAANGEMPDMICSLLVATLYDPATDALLFTQEGDIEALSHKSGKVVTDLFLVAQHLSGLDTVADAKNA